MKCGKKQKILRIVLTVISVLIILFIFYQSLKPGEVSSAQSSRVLVFLNTITSALGFGELFTHNFVRTCAHFAEFFVLGASLYFTYRTYSEKNAHHTQFSFITASVVAITDEILQLFTDGRAFQIVDILIDMSGALLSAIFMFVLFKIRNYIGAKGKNNVTNKRK